MSLDYTLQIISVISGVFPVLAILYNYGQYNMVLKIASAYFLISFLVDVGLWLAQKSGTKNDMPVIHLFLGISLAFFTIIYYHLFFKTVLKKIVLALAAVATIILLYDALRIWEIPSASNTALSIFLIILSLIYFYQLLSRQEFIYIEKQGWFWINAGVLFYSSVNIFFFMLYAQLPKGIQKDFYVIHSSTNIIANLLYSTGLLCKPQKTA